jgi:hypothetical protein
MARMRLSIDIAARVSPELSSIIGQLINDPDLEEPVTLAAVRRYVAGGPVGRMEEAEQLHPGELRTLLVEIDALIGQFTPMEPGAPDALRIRRQSHADR